MDYTLIHYHVDVWERRAYERTRDRLLARGWPVADLIFEPELVTRALIIDTELGNLVKSDRFGYVKVAAHGTKPLDYSLLREEYSRTIVDLRDTRWEFLNTLFSISIGCLFAQCVDLLDQRLLPPAIGYRELYQEVQRALDMTHIEGELKEEIIAAPASFVDVDPELLTTLIDQRDSGKKLILITNSEWSYTDNMMRWYIEDQLKYPGRWSDLFDLVVVQARKPDFFLGKNPMYEVIDASGNLRPLGPAENPIVETGHFYFGGSAAAVEKTLALRGQDILYVGDHIFADVHASKRTVRWRTALVLRELEGDIAALDDFAATEKILGEKMQEKTAAEFELSLLRLEQQRCEFGRMTDTPERREERDSAISGLKRQLSYLDAIIAPMAEEASRHPHPQWGSIMRTGIDKSHIARQIERYADIYFSRVSNLSLYTPLAYFRPPKSGLPHDA